MNLIIYFSPTKTTELNQLGKSTRITNYFFTLFTSHANLASFLASLLASPMKIKNANKPITIPQTTEFSRKNPGFFLAIVWKCLANVLEMSVTPTLGWPRLGWPLEISWKCSRKCPGNVLKMIWKYHGDCREMS